MNFAIDEHIQWYFQELTLKVLLNFAKTNVDKIMEIPQLLKCYLSLMNLFAFIKHFKAEFITK